LPPGPRVLGLTGGIFIVRSSCRLGTSDEEQAEYANRD
jgi:hypothetical protein